MVFRHQRCCCLMRTNTAKGFTIRSIDETEHSSVVLGVVHTEAQNGVGIFPKRSLPMSVSNLFRYNLHPSHEGTEADPISNGNNLPCRTSQRN
jgi:hypothetical protein